MSLASWSAPAPRYRVGGVAKVPLDHWRDGLQVVPGVTRRLLPC